MMLQDMLAKDLVEITDRKPKDWQEALKIAAEKLVEHGYIKEAYIDEIIKNVEDNGPYIVIVPGVAMPHANAKSDNVVGTAIGFTKFNDSVDFGPDSHAKLFFTLAARDPDEHLKNIGELSDMLMTDGLIEKLMDVKNIDDLKEIIGSD
ncbi:PTS sugar transporter subunit IIA [Companilactobacillus suantsaicola]|uniref:Ascorbate-specific PTS system EIIA component n=1 Tax=Companilactobacillus suantsaicola TaxID=2487723 RepID=A0A4Z0JMA5_9LACO|nr:PTS sugar transporter subunit IIA [Companilactobacillus suantsaicola]TGD23175.1 PTS sugar transporter subunit IIA [Companilactobacillus suantsaicola]